MERGIEALRVVLKSLHSEIETLRAEAAQNVARGGSRHFKLRKRIEDAQKQEDTILAKLAKSGVKL